MEDELQYTFLPALFKGATSQIPDRAITGMPFKQTGIDLPNHTQTTGANWTASCVITGHLIAAPRGTAEFRPGYNALLIGEGREEIQRRHEKAAETYLGEAWAAASKTDARRLGRIQRMGAWLSVITSRVNGTELWLQEWRDYLFLPAGPLRRLWSSILDFTRP